MMGIVTYGMKKNNMVMPEMQDPSCEEMFAPYHPSASEPNLTVSLWGQKHSVSIRDISQLTLAQFSSIWTVSLCYNFSLVHTCQLLLMRCKLEAIGAIMGRAKTTLTPLNPRAARYDDWLRITLNAVVFSFLCFS